MNKLFLAIMMILLAAAVMPASASASWSQGFNESGVGVYDKMEIFMLTPAKSFESTGFSEFTDAGWSSTLVNPQYAVATKPGSTTTNMNFSILFHDPAPVTFDFLAWRGNTVLERATATLIQGGNWTIAPLTTVAGNYNRTATPIPAAAWLLGSGLIGMVILKRKACI